MQRERPPLDWPLLVALGVVTLDLMIKVPTVQAPPADAVVEVMSPASAAVDAPPVASEQERVEDELAAEFQRVRIIGLDPSTAPIAAFEALARARTLAVVLELRDDGALVARMRVVAPEAVAAYRLAGDANGAETAQRTAEMVGAR